MAKATNVPLQIGTRWQWWREILTTDPHILKHLEFDLLEGGTLLPNHIREYTTYGEAMRDYHHALRRKL